MRFLWQSRAGRGRAGGRPRPPGSVPRRAALAAGAFAAVSALAGFRFAPRAEAAVDVTPWEGLSPFDDLLEGAGEVAGEVIKSGFEYIVNSLFGGAPAELTLAVLRWLVAIPNLSGGAVRELEQTTSVIALALLACVMTISVARYLGAGLASGGSAGFAGLEGIGRGVVAVCAIAVWPFAFDALAEIAGAASRMVLSGEGTTDNVAKVLATGVGVGTLPGIGLLFGIVIAVVGTVLLLALVGMKILVSALTVVVYVGGPIAFVLWVIPELGWVATTATRVLFAVLAIPLVWALVFAAFGALWADTLLLKNNGGGEELGFAGSLADVALIKPMVALSLLYLAIVVPKRLVQMAPLVSGGAGPLAAIGGLATNAALHRAIPYAPLGAPAIAAAGGGLRAASSAAAAEGAPSAAARPSAALGAGALAGASLAGAGIAAAAPAGAAAAGEAAPVASGSSAAGSGPPSSVVASDRYGGPKQAMTPERSEAIAQSFDRMRRAPQRPRAAEVAAAHASLSPGLREAVARAAREAPSHEHARKALASWSAHPAAREHRAALETIGAGSERDFRESVIPTSGQSPPARPASDAAPPGGERPTPARDRGALSGRAETRAGERPASPRRDPRG